jgi:6-phosphofructokinase 1
MEALFEEEGGNLFDVRQAILGHLQEGGDPSPFDRIQATRLASACIDYLISQSESQSIEATFIGWQKGKLVLNNFEDFTRMVEWQYQRPKNQWWLELQPIAQLLAQSGPTFQVEL